jgi:hypothetical protein
MPRSARAAPGSKLGGSLGHLTVTSEAARAEQVRNVSPFIRMISRFLRQSSSTAQATWN